MIKRIYTEKSEERGAWLDAFNDYYSNEQTRDILKEWLKEFGLDDKAISEISERVTSGAIDEIIAKNNDIVTNNIHAKGIPTLIYDGKKHTGRYEVK